MSLAGGYSATFSNNDRTTQLTGAPGRRPGRWEDNHDQEDHVEPLSRQNALSGKEDKMEPTTAESDNSTVENNRRASIVQGLARQYTQQSHHSTILGNPFQAGEDSMLNPHSENFSAINWAKSIVQLNQASGQSMRTAGVAYKNLNVFGYGQATDYQKDVANVWLEVASLPQKLIGRSSKTKIDILRDFDGVVRNGEMLVVLGPPGSGCSTFLKTISGETNGIYLNDEASFNYRGPFLRASQRQTAC